VLAETEAAAFLAPAPQPLVLAENATAAFLTQTPRPLVQAKVHGIAGLLECSRMQLHSCDLA